MASANSDAPATPYLPESLFPELAGIIEATRNNAPDLEAQALLEDEARARLKQARGRRLPEANAYLQTGPREEYRSGGAEDNSYFAVNAGVRVSQPLYHWGSIKAEIERARLALDGRGLERLAEEIELIRRLRSDYLHLILNRRHHIKEQARLALAEEEYERIRIEHEAGKRAEVDLNDKQLAAERVRLSLLRIEAHERVLRDRFRQTYAFPGKIATTKTLPEIDIDTAMAWLRAEEEALDGSRVYDFIPVRRQMGMVREQEEYLKMVRTEDRPKFNLFIAGNQGNTNTATENDVNSFSVTAGVSVNWNLFDGFRTRQREIEARLKRNRLEIGLQRRVSELRSEQERMLEAMGLRLRELEIMERSYEIRKIRHRSAEIDVEEGRITENEYQNARLQLDSLEIQRDQARVDVLLGFSDYDSFTRMVAED